jgi:formate dehydrogenase maturation protein FdhE
MTIILKKNFKKCPMCGSRNLAPHLHSQHTEKEVPWVRCEDCTAMFVRSCSSNSPTESIVIWNRRGNGTKIEPESTSVFVTPEDPEVVHFT